MKAETVLFRCDANPGIGIGHVMRCMALAQAWHSRGGNSVFAVRALPDSLETRIRTEGLEVVRIASASMEEDARATIALARASSAKWIVVDGDAFEVDFLRDLHQTGLHILLLDDFARRSSFPADLILNPNLGATDHIYRECTSARLLMGSEYVPLRREFTSLANDRLFPQKARRVFVSLGGSDPENLAPRIAETLRDHLDLEVLIVAGPSYEHWEELQAAARQDVHALKDPPDIAHRIAESDLAITAAGGTLCELLYCGCPVLSYSRNPVQARVVRSVAEQGAARDLGEVANFTPSKLLAAAVEIAANRALRISMADCARRLIDGRGAHRVAEAMQSFP